MTEKNVNPVVVVPCRTSTQAVSKEATPKGVTFCRTRRKYKAQAHVRLDFKCYKVINLGYALTAAGAAKLYKQFQSEKAEAR